MSGAGLCAQVSRSGSSATVTLTGELDLATAGELRRRVADLVVGQSPPDVLVLDLAGLTFVDAAGISALLSAQRAVTAYGGQLVLRSPSRLVRRVVRVLDLERVLPVEP